MNYKTNVKEVITLDSYRNNRFGGYTGNNYRGGTPRCVSADPPCRSRCVTPNESCYNTRKPDCDRRPDYDRRSDCDRRPDCDRKPNCGRKPDCDRKPDYNRKPDCDCDDNNKHMQKMRVGIGYVPMQKWGEMYDPSTALCQGTAFPDLNLIFCGVRG
ncbi:MAG: spore coat associated protein CotJA [Wujia sp.]